MGFEETSDMSEQAALIAELLDMQPGTVRVQLSRGRAQMRGLLKGDYFDE